MISVEKPGSPSEILEHHGVKGQKWGVRQRSQYAGQKAGKAAAKEARKSGAGRREQRSAARKAGSAVAKETSKKLRTENKAARSGMGLTKSSREFAGKFPAGKARTAEIHRSRAQVMADVSKIQLQKNPAKRADLTKAFLQNPDRATSLRMTRGEKVVAAIIAVGLPGPGTGAVAGYTGTTVAIRKSIEGAQRRRAGK